MARGLWLANRIGAVRAGIGIQIIGRFGVDRGTLEAAPFGESALAKRK